MCTPGDAGPQIFRGPAKGPRPTPPRRAGQGSKSTERGGAGRLFGSPSDFPVPGVRLLTEPHKVLCGFIAVSTVLFTVATIFFTVAMVSFAPYVKSRRFLSS